MGAISFTYKFYPLGNSNVDEREESGPKLYPWIGGGGGVYIQNEFFSSGPHLSAGVTIPMTRFFEVGGEVRSVFTNDFRITLGTILLGFRF
jgi:hypothetical protein